MAEVVVFGVVAADVILRVQRIPAPGDHVNAEAPTLVDPYRDYLRERRVEEPGVPVQQLLREIRERGYPGSSNLLVRYINQGRADADRPHIAPRKAAQILLTRPDNLTDGQRETAARLSSACPEMKALASLIGSFAAMLDPGPANDGKLVRWIADARAADLPHLHSFTRGLDLDIKAATAAVTLPHHNGRTEGVNNKTKMSNGRCSGAPASASSATASFSDEDMNRHHRKCDRALSLTPRGVAGSIDSHLFTPPGSAFDRDSRGRCAGDASRT